MKSITQGALLVACAAAAVGPRLGSVPREINVSPSASGAPVIGSAIEAVPPGSILRIRKGVYREYVSISKPISLVGDEGAVIDPSQPFRPQWEPATAFGKGVYRAAVERAPASLFLDGLVFAEVDTDRDKARADGPWNWKRLLAAGPGRSGFRCIRGLWLYRSDEHTVYVHLENDGDPAARNWSVVWTRDPVVSLRSAEGASIRGLEIARGFNGVYVTDNCRRCSVLRCKIGPWDKYGIALRGGAAESLIEGNEIFRGAYEDWTPYTIVRDGRLSGDKDWYEVWQVHKLTGLYDRIGIVLTGSGPGNRIHANRIHDVFDGIDVSEFPETLDAKIDVQLDRGAEIWDNLIENTRDSGMEVGGGAIDLKIHHNTLRRTHGGLRYKLPRTGPVFIYRNVLYDGSPFNIWYSIDDSPAEGYVYQNTVVGGKWGLLYSSWDVPPHRIGAPHWRYLNNLFVAERGFFTTEMPLDLVPINFTADYNVIQGGGRPYPPDSGKDTHSRYITDMMLAPGFPPKPLPGSPAIDAGLDLSTYFHGGPLPGCEPGYFKGKAPDAGAFEIQ